MKVAASPPRSGWVASASLRKARRISPTPAAGSTPSTVKGDSPRANEGLPRGGGEWGGGGGGGGGAARFGRGLGQGASPRSVRAQAAAHEPSILAQGLPGGALGLRLGLLGRARPARAGVGALEGLARRRGRPPGGPEEAPPPGGCDGEDAASRGIHAGAHVAMIGARAPAGNAYSAGGAARSRPSTQGRSRAMLRASSMPRWSPFDASGCAACRRRWLPDR